MSAYSFRQTPPTLHLFYFMAAAARQSLIIDQNLDTCHDITVFQGVINSSAAVVANQKHLSHDVKPLLMVAILLTGCSVPVHILKTRVKSPLTVLIRTPCAQISLCLCPLTSIRRSLNRRISPMK
jgi:hypothetical protein